LNSPQSDLLCPFSLQQKHQIPFLKIADLGPVEAKLHDESILIQRCFDDNKDDDKGDDKKVKGQSKKEFKMFKDRIKNTSRFKRKVEEHFKIQEESWFQESRIKNQESRFKTQDSRIKRRLNQDKYEKVFSKTE